MQVTFKKQLVRRIAVAGAIIAVFVIVIIILNLDINKRIDRIAALKNEHALKIETISVITELKRDSQKVKLYDAKLREALPSRDELIAFPRELQALATSRNLSFGFSFGTEAARTETAAGTTQFSLSLAGGLENVLGFLRDFERHRYFTSLSSIDLVKKDATTFTLNTSGEIYTQ